MMTSDATETTIRFKPLRITGLVVGGLLLLFSLGAWFPYLGASLRYLGTASSGGPGATNQGIVGALFGFWLLLWVPGLLIVLGAAAGWLRRTRVTLIVLTGTMLLISGCTALTGMLIG